MMRKVQILLALCLLCLNSAKAQSFFINPDTSVINENSGGLASLAYAYVYNQTNDTLHLVWERVMNIYPSNWYTSVCDEWVCHDSNTVTFPFFIEPGDSSPLVGHFAHFDNPGSGLIQLNVFDPLDSANSLTVVTYIANITAVGFDEKRASLPIDIYPNPFTNIISIDWPYNNKEISFRFFNSLGQELFRTKEQANFQLSTENWQPGLYFWEVEKDGIMTKGKLLKY